MNTLILSSLAVIGVAQFFVSLKNANRFTSFFILLFFTAGLTYTLEGFESPEAGKKLVAFSIIFMAAHYILSSFLQKSWMKYLAALSCLSLLIFSNHTINFLDYPLIFNFKNILLLPIITLSIVFAIYVKTKLIAKFFPDLNVLTAVNFIGTGLLILASLFFGSVYGLVISSVILYVMESYLNQENEEKSYNSLLVFSLALVFYIVQKNGIPVESFLHGSTLFGLMTGAGIALSFSFFKNNPEGKNIQKIVVFAFALLFVLAAIYLELFKEHLGGVSAFSGLIAGFLIKANSRNSSMNVSFLSIAFVIMICALPKFIPVQQAVETEDSFLTETDDMDEEITPQTDVKDTSSVKAADETPFEGTRLSEIPGSWKISKGSKLTFELGPKDARTKGYFKTVQGDFVITDSLPTCSLKVKIPAKGISTDNTYRDQSLVSAEFLDEATYPDITFTAEKFKEGAGKYIVSGTMSMKGVKKKLKMELKVVKQGKDSKGDFAILKGKSSLDRTNFKMESDPKIGDLVEFKFEIELRK